MRKLLVSAYVLAKASASLAQQWRRFDLRHSALGRASGVEIQGAWDSA
jgi:hypothetical protein